MNEKDGMEEGEGGTWEREIGRNDTQMSKQARRIIRRFNMIQYGLEEGLNTWMASGDQHPAPYCAKLEMGSSS